MQCPKCKEYIELTKIIDAKVDDIIELILHLRTSNYYLESKMYDYFNKKNYSDEFMYKLLEILLKIANREKPETLREIEERLERAGGNLQVYAKLLEEEMKEALDSFVDEKINNKESD